MHWTHLNLANQSNQVVWLNLTSLNVVGILFFKYLCFFQNDPKRGLVLTELELFRYVLKIYKTSLSFVLKGQDSEKSQMKRTVCHFIQAHISTCTLGAQQQNNSCFKFFHRQQDIPKYSQNPDQEKRQGNDHEINEGGSPLNPFVLR